MQCRRRRVIRQVEAGGKIVGAAAGNVSNGWRGGELHGSGNDLVEGSVTAAADHAVKVFAVGQQEPHRIAPGGCLPYADKIPCLAETGDGFK